MNKVRTPKERFEGLPDYAFEPHYVEIDGVRMHYVDEGQGDETVLCLHGQPSWSYLYRKMIPILAGKHRVVAPDFIGFGKSDKYTEIDAYTYEMHRDALVEFIKALDLTRITLVCQDWGGLIGLRVAGMLPERFDRLVIMNTGLPVGTEKTRFNIGFRIWQFYAMRVPSFTAGGIVQTATVNKIPDEVVAAYNAPFPDRSYMAGARKWPSLVPIKKTDPAAGDMRAAREALAKWDKPAQVMFSDGDPLTRHYAEIFRELIPTAKERPEITIKGAGHFLQEDQGQKIAGRIIEFIEETPID